MRVVAFTGMPGAGKTDAVDEARRRNIPIVVMGDFVRAEAQARGLEAVDANLGRVAQEMRAKHGTDVFAQRTADAILKSHAKAPLVVVDGVRSLPEIEAFRRRFGANFQLVAIQAPDVQRYVRMKSRGRSDDSHGEQQMRQRDEREKAWGLVEAIRNADAHIENNRSLEDFRVAISALFDRLTASAPGASGTAPARPASGTRP